TTLYDLIPAIQEVVGADDDALGVATLVHLLWKGDAPGAGRPARLGTRRGVRRWGSGSTLHRGPPQRSAGPRGQRSERTPPPGRHGPPPVPACCADRAGGRATPWTRSPVEQAAPNVRRYCGRRRLTPGGPRSSDPFGSRQTAGQHKESTLLAAAARGLVTTHLHEEVTLCD